MFLKNIKTADDIATELKCSETTQLLEATDKEHARSVDDIIAYLIDGTPIPQVVLDRQAIRKEAREISRS